ncbi:MAG: chromophore lyase CpcT/CpeT [Ignavibacteria bacterium]
MKNYFLIILFSLLIGSLNAQIEIPNQDENVEQDDLSLLASYLQGSFSSEEQSQKDTTYFNIVLHMKRMWHDRTDGIWIYAEQASVSSADKPYKQRIYRLTQLPDGSFESAVFTFPDPLKYAGDWKSEKPLENLNPSNLTQRKGCSVFMRKNDDGSFTGSTKGKNCESDLRSAKYATSEVIIKKDAMISWDRGFNEKDEQVWGTAKGGYIFKKLNN